MNERCYIKINYIGAIMHETVRLPIGRGACSCNGVGLTVHIANNQIKLKDVSQ